MLRAVSATRLPVRCPMVTWAVTRSTRARTARSSALRTWSSDSRTCSAVAARVRKRAPRLVRRWRLRGGARRGRKHRAAVCAGAAAHATRARGDARAYLRARHAVAEEASPSFVTTPTRTRPPRPCRTKRTAMDRAGSARPPAVVRMGDLGHRRTATAGGSGRAVVLASSARCPGRSSTSTTSRARTCT